KRDPGISKLGTKTWMAGTSPAMTKKRRPRTNLMSRRHRADKREILPDPKFGNVVVTKFMNSIMYEGKKSVAESIVYGALDIIEGKTKQNPIQVFQQALDNVMPSIEVRSRRVGGATYQVPVELRIDRRHPLAHHRCARAQRENHDRAAFGRAARRVQQSGERRQEARGHAPHGRGQPRLLALSLVTRSNDGTPKDYANAPHARDRGLPQL